MTTQYTPEKGVYGPNDTLPGDKDILIAELLEALQLAHNSLQTLGRTIPLEMWTRTGNEALVASEAAIAKATQE